MARELKFRVFNKSESRMILASAECVFTQDGRVFEGGIECNGAIMQYTGMLDKNGVEIFEGDVVKFEKYGLYEISYRDDYAAYAAQNNAKEQWWEFDSSYGIRGEQLEIVGNIYNNPELLA